MIVLVLTCVCGAASVVMSVLSVRLARRTIRRYDAIDEMRRRDRLAHSERQQRIMAEMNARRQHEG